MKVYELFGDGNARIIMTHPVAAPRILRTRQSFISIVKKLYERLAATKSLELCSFVKFPLGEIIYSMYYKL